MPYTPYAHETHAVLLQRLGDYAKGVRVEYLVYSHIILFAYNKLQSEEVASQISIGPQVIT